MRGSHAPGRLSEIARLTSALDGYRATCLIVTAVQVGIIDRLEGGPASTQDLAQALGAHALSLERFVRALTALGLVEGDASRIQLTSSGRLLLSGSPVRDLALLVDSEYLPAWTALPHALLTGRTAFEHVFGVNAWKHREANTELNEAFNRVMSDVQERTLPVVLSRFDFSKCELVVDVGGGYGTLMAGILEKYPGTRGVVFDQPHVVAGAQHALRLAGVLDRCEVVAGSFFDGVPEAGDVYLLQHVLHDWNDEQCAAILRSCWRAMTPGKTLLVVESMMPEQSASLPALVLRDLHMLAVLGGRERTLPEYEALLERAGFEVAARLRESRAGTRVIETRKVA